MDILQQLKDSVEVKQKVMADAAFIKTIQDVCDLIIKSYKNGGKVLIAGNGGSAADAQHIAGELVSRFYFDRPALAAIALTTDTSILTAIGNDYGYERVFSRQIEANANSGDVFIAISTSGNSANILAAIEVAKQKGVSVVGFTGEKPCKMDAVCDFMIKAPSASTPRIQETHITVGHIICAVVEDTIFKKA